MVHNLLCIMKLQKGHCRGNRIDHGCGQVGTAKVRATEPVRDQDCNLHAPLTRTSDLDPMQKNLEEY
jgi:hypothetical protein